MRKLFGLLLVVFVVGLYVYHQRVFLRDPLGSMFVDGTKVAEAEIRYRVVPFPNETLKAAMLETARRVGLPEELQNGA